MQVPGKYTEFGSRLLQLNPLHRSRSNNGNSMTVSTPTTEEQPSQPCFQPSFWDKLPRELHDMIIDICGPLTRFLNNDGSLADTNDLKTVRSIWLDAFDIDWHGDLSKLPLVSHRLSFLTNKDVCRVKSMSMYTRLCDLFPEYTESNKKYHMVDDHTNSIKIHFDNHGTIGENETTLVYARCGLRFLHILLHHMWLDVPSPGHPHRTSILHHHASNTKHDVCWILQYPFARANDCVIEGHVDMLSHLIDTGLVAKEIINEVVTFDDMYDMYSVENSMDVAAKNGHLGILETLHKAGCDSVSCYAMNCAAMNGHLDVVKWLHTNRDEGCTTDAMDYAAEHGHLDVVQWLHENRSEGCTTWAMDGAAMYGHLHVIKWLHENRTEGCTTDAMDHAAANGHLETVKWLHQNRSEGCTTDAMNDAAFNGHIETVMWLHGNRTESCTPDAMDFAAKNGHYDIVKYLHGNITGMAFPMAMNWASDRGHLEIVKFLHENRIEGCTVWAIDRASENGHIDIVKWLLENRSEGFSVSAIAYAKSDEIAQLLISHFDTNQQREFWRDLRRMGCKRGPGYDALRSSINKNRFNAESCIVM